MIINEDDVRRVIRSVITEDTESDIHDIAIQIDPDTDKEVAFVDGEEIKGEKDKVEIEVDVEPSDEYIVHTHPAENATIFHTVPSEEDLKSAVKLYGIRPGLVIFSGNYFSMTRPKRDNITISNWDSTVKNAFKGDDFDSVVRKLESMGFDFNYGKKEDL